MKKTLLILSLLTTFMSNNVFAAGNDFRYTRRDSTNTVNLNIDVPTPAASSFPIIDINGGTATVKHVSLGTGLAYTTGSPGNIAVSSAPISAITNLQSSLDDKQPVATTLTDLSGISISSDVLAMMGDVSGVSGVANTIASSLALDTAAFQPASAFASASHTHIATQISDSTSTGRSVLTATNASAARSAIGAGTSSFSGDYNDLTNKPTITNYTDEQAQDAVGNIITGTGNINVTYSDAGNTIVVSDVSKTFNYTTRSLNTCFQVSSTRDATVNYAVDVGTTLSLSGGTTGTVYLRTYTNSSCTTGAQEITRFVNGNTGTLTVGLNISQNVTGTVSGVIPAGKYVQLVTENTTGTPTFTSRPGQETLF